MKKKPTANNEDRFLSLPSVPVNKEKVLYSGRAELKYALIAGDILDVVSVDDAYSLCNSRLHGWIKFPIKQFTNVEIFPRRGIPVLNDVTGTVIGHLPFNAV